MANGNVLHCWRCGEVVLPHEYSLGHCDDTKAVIHGPEHYHRCNQANANSTRPCPHPSHSTPAPPWGGTPSGDLPGTEGEGSPMSAYHSTSTGGG